MVFFTTRTKLCALFDDKGLAGAGGRCPGRFRLESTFGTAVTIRAALGDWICICGAKPIENLKTSKKKKGNSHLITSNNVI